MRAIPIVALDVPAISAALAIVDDLGERCRFFKIGGELFTAEGPDAVRAVLSRGADVFLDLKFHDIPNTVRASVASAARLGVRLVTVHASGGRFMLEAATEGANDGAMDAAKRGESGGGGRCKVLAVSVLTSLDAAGLGEAWGRTSVRVDTEVVRLARLAETCGVDGLVCSALEAGIVREEVGDRLTLVVPGIRTGGSADDQKRIATPAVAAAAGATFVVVGRAVTGAPDRRAAMEAVLVDLGIDVSR